MLFDVAVHELAAGHKQLLQKSRNEAGHQAGSFAHLDCRLRLKKGERHLLLGKNGCGKTTLLRCIAERELEGLPQSLSVFLVEQEAALNKSLTPLQAVLAADAVNVALQDEAKELEDSCEKAAHDSILVDQIMERLMEVYDQLGEEDESQRCRRAVDILQGLGFGQDMQEKPVHLLSGGWQMRTALAAGLFMRPELLLLDEPTNGLDLNAISWLQNHLACDYKGTILCVSHDRAFINHVATQIVSFAEHRLEYFSGNLDDLDREAAKKSCNLERQVAALDRKREHIQKSLVSMENAVAKSENNRAFNKENTKYASMQGGCRSGGGQVAQRKKKLERMGLEKTLDGKKYKAQDQEGPRIGAACNNDGGWVNGKMTAAPILSRGDPALQFGFEAEHQMELPEDEYLLELHGASYQFTNSAENVLSDVNLAVKENCRIACIGRNGAGKSTLLKLLSGQLAPSHGNVVWQRGLQVAYFGQHDAELLRLPASPLEHLQAAFPKAREQTLQAALEEFGICDSIAFQAMDTLSGGQRMRVAFARLSIEKPHLLVLDEPTNHLDIYAIEALIDALQKFKGSVIFVTHNQSLLQKLAQQVITVKDSGITVEHLSNNQVLGVKDAVIKADNMILLD